MRFASQSRFRLLCYIFSFFFFISFYLFRLPFAIRTIAKLFIYFLPTIPFSSLIWLRFIFKTKFTIFLKRIKFELLILLLFAPNSNEKQFSFIFIIRSCEMKIISYNQSQWRNCCSFFPEWFWFRCWKFVGNNPPATTTSTHSHTQNSCMNSFRLLVLSSAFRRKREDTAAAPATREYKCAKRCSVQIALTSDGRVHCCACDLTAYQRFIFVLFQLVFVGADFEMCTRVVV